jgi:hypothetical protein
MEPTPNAITGPSPHRSPFLNFSDNLMPSNAQCSLCVSNTISPNLGVSLELGIACPVLLSVLKPGF